MAISTYSDLQTAISNWLHRSDLASIIQDLILIGENRVYRNLRVRKMEESISDTIDPDGTWTLPADYVDLKNLRVTAGGKYHVQERKTVEWIWANDRERELAPGIPKYVARREGYLIFSPFPASEYPIEGTYYKRLASVSSAVNDLFTDSPELWLFAALAESEPYLKNDKRVALWEAKFNQIISELNAEEYRENSSGSRLTMAAG